MIYLLDTNVCIAAINPGESPIKECLARHAPADLALCSVVRAELLWGAWRSRRPESNLALLEKFFALFRSLPFDDSAAQHYGRIRANLTAKGTPIGPNDLMIAAIALAHDLILVSHNTREFSRVEGLRLEDWQCDGDRAS
jgi:tRNA(fMet)-specific endonuclease VapC